MLERPRRRFLAVPLVLLAALGLLPAAARAADPPALDWSGCGGVFQCATASVPLDHGQPAGPQISLALIRIPASDAAQRIGSLFVNPGGPGGSGVEFVRYAGGLFPAEIRRRFDIVGFDPRGIGSSSPLLCFASLAEVVNIAPHFRFPVTPQEEAVQEAFNRTLAIRCARQGGPIIDHMSTASVARDLDALRAAVGDKQLNYLGISYGTYLGATYANLFPANVGTMVIDGVVDPVGWSTGRGDADTQPFTTRLRSDESARQTLGEFFRLCDQAGTACAFSGQSEAHFAALADRLKARPVPVVLSGAEVPYGYSELVSDALGAMYDPAAWPSFAAVLSDVEGQVAPTVAGAKVSALREVVRSHATGRPAYPNVFEGPPGVFCSDSDNPDRAKAWEEAAAAAEAKYGYFARPWTWISGACADWPGEDAARYTGPWDATTASPVLVIGNRFDPATPYENAVITSKLLGGSRLLTYEGWGHGALLRSKCVDDAVVGYLLSKQLPADGATCPAVASPFAGPG